MDNAQARATWEALKPEPGSILAYHMASAVASLAAQHDNPTDQPDYYAQLMTEMDEYETEQKEHGNDATYLAWCEQTFGPFIGNQN
jgi:hypothetical protein